MTCNPRTIIRPDRGTEKIRYRNGDTDNIITVIMDMDEVAYKSISPEAVECLRGGNQYETLRNVWRFVKHNVRYKPDARGREKVKSPAALFAAGSGDCKSFSIAEAAILKVLGFKNIRYRFASYSPGADVTHVYTVVKLGGQDVIMDAVHSRFDDEVAYSWKMDKKAAPLPAGVSGIHGPITPMSVNGLITIASAGLILWGFNKLGLFK